ncbi:hypothetical protein MKX03_022095 [Papaver bracteatum]|nr:hypothetical protein MKX03_022095 [Papaver bracteatum]
MTEGVRICLLKFNLEDKSWIRTRSSLDEMGIKNELLCGIYEYGHLLFSKGEIRSLCTIKLLILDEMLSRGFKDQTYDVCMISETLRHEILEITSKFMTEPARILVKCDELTWEGIKQFFVAVEKEEWKFDTSCDLYDTLTTTQAVIFCNTLRKVNWLTEKMHSYNLTSGRTRVLIATDAWACGVAVNFVRNYDIRILRDIEQYYSTQIDEMPMNVADLI